MEGGMIQMVWHYLLLIPATGTQVIGTIRQVLLTTLSCSHLSLLVEMPLTLTGRVKKSKVKPTKTSSTLSMTILKLIKFKSKSMKNKATRSPPRQKSIPKSASQRITKKSPLSTQRMSVRIMERRIPSSKKISKVASRITRSQMKMMKSMMMVKALVLVSRVKITKAQTMKTLSTMKKNSKMKKSSKMIKWAWQISLMIMSLLNLIHLTSITQTHKKLSRMT